MNDGAVEACSARPAQSVQTLLMESRPTPKGRDSHMHDRRSPSEGLGVEPDDRRTSAEAERSHQTRSIRTRPIRC